ncbi:MAG TPA: hypothetical protein VF134_00305 [Candidatus Dormibacteraeota bacterium]
MKRLGLLILLLATACGGPVTSPAAATAHSVAWITGAGYREDFIAEVEAASGRELAEMPLGAVASDLRREYVVSTPAQQMQTIDLNTGRVVRSLPLGGEYRLPIDATGMPAGLSANGRWLVLTGPDFRVVDTTGATPPRRLAFEGQMDFDAISDDGSLLYAIQRLGQQYAVRVYNVPAGMLDPNVVVGKGEPPVMAGVRGQSVFSPDHAWQFTIYRGGPTGAFIHALYLRQPIAWCVFLPQSPSTAAYGWSLAAAADRLYAANTMLRLAVAIDWHGAASPWEEPEIVKTGHLPATIPAANAFLINAEAKEIGGSLAVSPDGATLYAADAAVIQAIDTSSMAVRARWGAGVFSRIALGPRGDTLYWVNPEGQLVGIDTQTGAVRTHPRLYFGARAVLGVR